MLNCLFCKKESEYSVVCGVCRKSLTQSKRKRAMDRLYEICLNENIQEMTLFKDRHDNNYCFHCKIPFEKEQICLDHFWYTKAVRPDLVFDIRVVVPCCQRCNTSGSELRKNPKTMECPFDFISPQVKKL